MPKKYDAEIRARAVHLVRQGRGTHRSEWSTIVDVATDLGLNPETLRTWLRADETAALGDVSVSKEAAREIRALRRRNQQLQERLELLTAASDFFRAGGSPADQPVSTRQALRFIDAYKDRFGVAPICRVLSEHGVKISPRTYHAWLARPPSNRAKSDAKYTQILAGYYEPDEEGRLPPEAEYGSARMWHHLREQGHPIGKSTVERLMRQGKWQGRRGRRRRKRHGAVTEQASAGSGPTTTSGRGPGDDVAAR